MRDGIAIYRGVAAAELLLDRQIRTSRALKTAGMERSLIIERVRRHAARPA